MEKGKPIKKRKPKEEAFDHWQPLVETFFKFCVDNLGEKPSFDGSQPRDMKMILTQLRKRAEEHGVAWREDEAKIRWFAFLSKAHKNEWLKEHWTLSNLNRQKDTIFMSAPSSKKPDDKKTSTELPKQDVYDYIK